MAGSVSIFILYSVEVTNFRVCSSVKRFPSGLKNTSPLPDVHINRNDTFIFSSFITEALLEPLLKLSKLLRSKGKKW